jgi:hypothetical protein
MERPQRDFKGIWIPREIWLSDQLSLMEKVLFVEIHSLDNERGCFASNKYFADFFGVSDRQIRTYIGSLKEKGFISVTIQNRNERIIRVVVKHAWLKAADVTRLKESRAGLVHRWGISSQRR